MTREEIIELPALCDLVSASIRLRTDKEAIGMVDDTIEFSRKVLAVSQIALDSFTDRNTIQRLTEENALLRTDIKRMQARLGDMAERNGELTAVKAALNQRIQDLANDIRQLRDQQ